MKVRCRGKFAALEPLQSDPCSFALAPLAFPSLASTLDSPQSCPHEHQQSRQTHSIDQARRVPRSVPTPLRLLPLFRPFNLSSYRVPSLLDRSCTDLEESHLYRPECQVNRCSSARGEKKMKMRGNLHRYLAGEEEIQLERVERFILDYEI